jgi:DME family drug/metabolite transporter
VIVAASLWASLGLFYRVLAEDYGLQEVTIVAYCAGIAAIVLFVLMALVRPALLVVRQHDWLYFLLFGVVGEAAFYLCYIQATLRGPLAVAAVLQYTSAIWIMLWAVFRHGERLTMRKGLVLGIALCGCTLVAGGWQVLTTQLNGLAISFGLLAGLSYAVYSLCSAAGTRRGYHMWTVVAYSLGIGAVLLFALQPLDVSLRPLRLPGAWPYLLGAALGPTLVAPLCFTYGVRYIKTSSASILAMVEPVVAAALGWLVVVPSEPLSGSQLVGGGAVVIAMSLLERDRVSSIVKLQLVSLRKLVRAVRQTLWYA